jgi:hypothetical protein
MLLLLLSHCLTMTCNCQTRQEADLVGRSEAGSRVVSQVGASFLLRGEYAQLWSLLKPLVALQQQHGGVVLPFKMLIEASSWRLGNDSVSKLQISHPRTLRAYSQFLSAHAQHRPYPWSNSQLSVGANS